MAHVVATATAFPETYYPQEVLATVLRKYCMAMLLEFDLDQIDRFFNNVQIKGRYFALPLDSFYDPPGYGTTAPRSINASVDLCETAVTTLLERAQISPQEISQIFSTTLTIAIPSIDVRLMNRLPFPEDLKRSPMGAVGCLGGALGLAKVADYLQGHPQEAVIFMAVELASALWQGSLQSDLHYMISRLPEEPVLYSDVISNLVTAALFGDGAGAVLMAGREHPLAQPGQPQIVDSQSCLIPHSEHLMGMEVVDTGMRNILKPQVGEFVKVGVRKAVDSLLSRHNLAIGDIAHWIVHPGGPKVISAIEEEFGLGEHTLQLSRDTLEQVGNLSSPTVLYMLDAFLAQHQPEAGTYGLLIGMGPGFSQEALLLQW